MSDISGLCFSCMRPLDGNGVCPHCAGLSLPVQESPMLALGTLINDRYYIGKAVKTNGEGTTYVAYDTWNERPCSLREFFPGAIASRDSDGVTVLANPGSEQAFNVCYEAFYKLWSKLKRLKGLTALISVYDVFKVNSTIYAVYSDSEETTLRSYLLSNGSGYLSWEHARIMFMPVLSTLSTLHTSGVIHRGIDPSALIISPDGKLKLTDFCTEQVKTAFGELDADISDGYAPLEVYSENGSTGPWTDIYSFTAVLFRALIGSTPIAATIRAQNDQMMIPAKFAEQLPPHVINAIINGMQIDEKERTHNAEQLRSNLSASPRAIGASASVFSSNTAALNAKTSQQRVQQVREYTQAAPVRVQNPVSQQKVERAQVQNTLAPERIQRARVAEEEANKKAKTAKFLKIFGIIIIIMVLFGAGLIISELINNSGEKPAQTTAAPAAETVVVPMFAGQMYDAVISDTFYGSMLTFKMSAVSSSDVARGQIISQDIPANTTVNRGTCILLTVSTGPEVFALPDVSGLTYEQALAALAPRSLICTKSTKYNDGTHQSGTVAETVPPANSQVSSGDTVIIVVWSDTEDSTLPGAETTVPTQPADPSQTTVPSEMSTAPVETFPTP